MPRFYPSLCGLALVTLLPAAPAKTPDEMPSLETIMGQVIARDRATQEQLQGMQYHQSVHTERLDGQGRVINHQDEDMIIRPGALPEIQVLSSQGDDIPSNPDEAAQKAKGEEVERRKHNFDLGALSTRFLVTTQGTEMEAGRKVYILSFEPKPNQPYRDQTEKVLNELHGRMWVRADDFLILRTDASLREPVRVAWILAKIKKLNFHYEIPSGGNDFGPAWLQTLVEVDAPLIQIRQRQRIDMTDFRSRAALSIPPQRNAGARWSTHMAWLLR